MQYRKITKEDAEAIRNLSIDDLGWTSSAIHLEEVLENYPGSVVLEGDDVCGFIYSHPLSTDILKRM